MAGKRKGTYKITNWSKYNESLVQRGSVTRQLRHKMAISAKKSAFSSGFSTSACKFHRIGVRRLPGKRRKMIILGDYFLPVSHDFSTSTVTTSRRFRLMEMVVNRIAEVGK